MTAPVVELRNISKLFSGVSALQNVSFLISPGECVGIVGENGAGKSTLMKILSGVWEQGSFDGDIYIEGKIKKFESPRQALNEGIAIVYQELSLFPELSVAENIFIRCLPSQHGIVLSESLHKKASHILEQLDAK